jgi:hypothetical protein
MRDLRLDELQQQAHKLLSAQRGMGSTGWLIVALGGFSLLYWNGRLFLATGAGVAVMLLVYLLHGWQPQLDWAELRASTKQLLRGWNQPFVISVGAGAIATVAVYLAAALYTESSSPWIASAAILQGMGTLAVLLLLVGQRVQRQSQRERDQFHHVLQELTHRDPLKRLIAVRQLTDLVSVLDEGSDRSRIPSGQPKQLSRRAIADYLQVMLSRENHPIVRDAVLDGLQTVDIVHQLQAATQPVLSKPVLSNPALSQPVSGQPMPSQPLMQPLVKREIKREKEIAPRQKVPPQTHPQTHLQTHLQTHPRTTAKQPFR